MSQTVSEILSQQLDDIAALAAYKVSNPYIEAIQQLPAHLDAMSKLFINVTNPPTPLTALKYDGTDEQIAARGILEYVNSLGGGTVVFPDGNIKISGLIRLYSNTHVILSPKTVIDFSDAATSATLFNAEGSEGTHINLSSNAIKGNLSISVTAGQEINFSVGDYIKIGSTETYDPGRTNQPIGELNKVISTASGVINLQWPLADSYDTTDTAFVAKMTMVENVKLTGGKIIGGGAASLHVGFEGDRCVNSSVSGTKFIDCEEKGVLWIDAINCNVYDVYVDGSNYSGTGYGVMYAYASQDCIIANSVFDNCRHATSTGGGTSRSGVPRRIHHNDLTAIKTTGDAFDTHACGEDLEFDNCVVYYADGNGFNIENNSVKMRSCKVKKTGANTNYHGVALRNETSRPTRYDIECDVENIGGYGVKLVNGATVGAGSIIDHINIKAITTDTASNGIVAYSTDTWRMKNITIEAVITRPNLTTGTSAFLLQKADKCNLGNIKITEVPATVTAMKIDNTTKTGLNGKINIDFASLSTGKGVVLGSCTDIGVTGVTVKDGGTGIQFDNGCSYCLAVGNSVRGCTTPISQGTGTGHVVASNLI
jgi:hypothetical protein